MDKLKEGGLTFHKVDNGYECRMDDQVIAWGATLGDCIWKAAEEVAEKV